MAKVTFPRTLRNVDARQLSRALDENMRYLETLLNKTFNFDHTILANVTADQHHVKYTDGEAVSAMGTKADDNPLNHDQGAGGGGGAGYRETVIFTSGGTFSKATYPWLTHIRVSVVGGGGGGGGGAATVSGEGSGGGGGGGGGFGQVDVAVGDLAASETVTVGAGGAGGIGGNAGATGADTSFGTDAVGKGGVGGGTMAPISALPFGTQGGAGGLASSGTGDLKISGEDGGQLHVPTAVRSWRNLGGASQLGAGSPSRFSGTGSSGGNPGKDYGGGGTGAWVSQSNAAATGGVGGDGIVIVELFDATGGGDALAAIRVNRITSAQVIPDSTATDIIFNSIVREDDPDGHFSMNTSTGVLTINTTGWYVVTATLLWEGTAVTGQRGILSIKATGGDISAEEGDHTTTGIRQSATGLWYFTATDTVKVEVYQTTAADLDIKVHTLTHMAAYKLPI